MPKVSESETIAGVWIAELDAFGDERGRFIETYRRGWFPEGREMVQQNRSEKARGAIVGLHYHLHQADYWTLGSGHIRVVLHDLREGAPTNGNTLAIDLIDGDYRGVFIPPGVAHGFATLADSVLYYSVDSFYNPDDELGMAWDDSALDIDWGLTDPILSERDKSNPTRSEIPAGRRPYWGLRT